MDTPTVLITGASGGIGLATAKRFAAAGADLILHTYQNITAVTDLQKKIRNQVGKVEIVTADFSQEDCPVYLLHQALQFTNRIDVLVNAAGLDLMSPSLTGLPFEKKLQRLLQTDVYSPIQLSRLVGKRMQEQKRGTIFFLGWSGTDYGWRGDTAQLYGTAKGALLGFSRSLAEDLAPDVLVRCLSLGWIKTRWGEKLSADVAQRYAADTRRNRWGTPEEVAEVIEFLSRKEAEYIDGIGLRLDGEKKSSVRYESTNDNKPNR